MTAMSDALRRPWGASAIACGLMACSGPDLTVAGHDFHLSAAYLEERTPAGAEQPSYQVFLSNMTDPCSFWRADEPVAVKQDDLWFQLGTEGPVYLDGARHPAFVAAGICVSDTIPCVASVPTHEVFETSGNEVFELVDERLHISLQFTHEVVSTDFSRPLEEPFDVDLDVGYTTCE